MIRCETSVVYKVLISYVDDGKIYCAAQLPCGRWVNPETGVDLTKDEVEAATTRVFGTGMQA